MNPLRRSRKTLTAARSGAAAALVACALLAAPAGAAASTPSSASHFYISGAGFGHGIGMSQYGAAGFALHGYTYRQILAHYYTATTLGHVSPDRTVTVLLHEGAASFRGASIITGSPIKLSPNVNYGVIPVGARLRIITRGRTIGTFTPPLTVRGTAPLTLLGQGRYRGSFVFRPDGKGGVMTINALGLDNYVRGVVSAEMPSSWPAQALEAQAVAARTYAITAGAVAADFDVYDDTRSQMYEGVRAETPTSDAAVAATTGQVVEYDGQPAVTYFFASSGGYTESVQNVFYGVAPEAWLVGVPDPYDDSYNNPYYRWVDRYAVSTASRKLLRYYKGAFEGIDITQTGVSPRVVRAQVVGTAGSSTVTGTQLQQLFGALSTYMSFTTLTESGERSSSPVRATTAPVTTTATTATTTPTPTTTTGSTPPPSSGGSGFAAAAAAAYLSVQGTVYPAQQGATVTAQLHEASGWVNAAKAQVTAAGAYVIPVASRGLYRVIYNGINGPNISVP